MTGQYGLLSPVWSGTDAAKATSDEHVLVALLQVESAWAETLAEAQLVPDAAARAIRSLAQQQLHSTDPPFNARALAIAGRAGGNPVIPLVQEIRTFLHQENLDDSALHQGATSQDVLDTALNLVTRQVSQDISRNVVRICDALASHALTHRETFCVARSLTQHALPTTFGLRATGWLDGVRHAALSLHHAVDALPLQWGGAVGTQAALAQWHGQERAAELTGHLADRLGMPATRPWHTQRQPLLSVASALAGLLAALGKIAGDVLLQQRPEFGELREGIAAGRGGSSAMPHKQNPVLSVLVRSAANSAPGLLSTLYASASSAQDERPAGAWHAEWAAFSELLRLAGGAAECAAEMLESLEVFPARMRELLDGAGDALFSERLMICVAPLLSGGKPAIQAAVQRAAHDQIPLRALIAEELRAQESSPDRDDMLEHLDRLFDPADYLGRTQDFIDHAVEEYQQMRTHLDRTTTPDTLTESAEPVLTPQLLCGTEEDLNNPALPVLVVGPALGTAVTALWGPAVKHLQGEAVVIGWDLPGHGSAPPASGPFTMTQLADAVESMVTRVAEDHQWSAETDVTVAGVSISGVVALTLALRAHTRFAKAAVICSAATIGTAESWEERAALVEKAGTPTMVAGASERWFAPGFIKDHPDISTTILHSLQRTDRHSYAHACRALGGVDLTEQLGAATRPLLCIAGEYDGVCTPAHSELIAARAPGAEAVTVPGVAHLAPAEAPEEITRLLKEFLHA